MAVSGRRDFLLGSGAATALVGARSSGASAQDQGPRLAAESEREIIAELDRADVVGAAITVVQDGQLRAVVPYGRASVPFDAPLRRRRCFRLGLSASM